MSYTISTKHLDSDTEATNQQPGGQEVQLAVPAGSASRSTPEGKAYFLVTRLG